MGLFGPRWWVDEHSAGYWGPKDDLPDAASYVDPTWKQQHPGEHAAVVQHLQNGQEGTHYRGWSDCRICGKYNGSIDMHDGWWKWPEGFLHYIVDHDVKPDQEFIDHVLGRKCVRCQKVAYVDHVIKGLEYRGHTTPEEFAELRKEQEQDGREPCTCLCKP